MDVSDIIDFNVGLLNSNDLSNSFFCLSKNDPTVGFPYDASKYTGHVFPQAETIASSGKFFTFRAYKVA